jgi:hypothetical protein
MIRLWRNYSPQRRVCGKLLHRCNRLEKDFGPKPLASVESDPTMKTLLISYDLRVPETSEDYKKLIKYIKSFGTWAKPLYSVWLVKTDKTCAMVRDEIKMETDSNDRTLVIEVTGADWATTNVDKEVTDWMKKNL